VKLLKLVAAEVGQLKNKIIIEGYIDARPYANNEYGNWELSSDRANMARRALEQNGVGKDQIVQVRGFADRNLKHPEKPLDFGNRRVSILVATTEAKPSDAITPSVPAVAPQKEQVAPKVPSIAPQTEKK
jgi:chemotaxis protein MotB